MIVDWVGHAERVGGWIAVALGGFILKKLHTVSIQLNGMTAKWVRAEKAISRAEGMTEQKELDR